MTTCSIMYDPGEYRLSGPRIMGRNVASESFIRAYLSYSASGKVFITARDDSHIQEFEARYSSQLADKKVIGSRLDQLGAHKHVGCIQYPYPNIDKHAYVRECYGHRSYSLCGITHTTLSKEIVTALGNTYTAPVYPWDAIVCTSLAVKKNIVKLLEVKKEYLKTRLGNVTFTEPFLPIIPLGVDTNRFDVPIQNRTRDRERLGIRPDDVVILFVGRLSFHAKSNPVALYMALESIARETSRNIVLIECGWYSNSNIKSAYETASEKLSPHVRRIYLDGTVMAGTETAWSVADVFCSLSDNLQETFGITPIEAMARGLPVVVSDWNGYKETVRHGIDGYRASTSMPVPGSSNDLAYRYEVGIDSYDRFCGYTSTLVSVSISETIMYLKALINNSDLRLSLGENGKERAKTTFDWSHIIKQYEGLWTELEEKRSRDNRPISSMGQTRKDPFYAFSHYPTTTINSETLLTLVGHSASEAKRKYLELMELDMINYAAYLYPEEEIIDFMLRTIENDDVSIVDLSNLRKDLHLNTVIRSASVLIKLGIVSISEMTRTEP